MKDATAVCCLSLVACILPGVGQQAGATASVQQPVSPQPGVSAETRLAGILLGVDQKTDAGTRVLLIKARLLGEGGVELRELQPRGSAILDYLVQAPVAITRTDSAGRFAFRAVPPGRYCVGVTPRPEGKFSPNDVTLLQRVGDTWSNLVFDIEPKQVLDLGKVCRKRE